MRSIPLLAGALALGFVAARPATGATSAREILDNAKKLDDTTRHWTDFTRTMTLHTFAARGGEGPRCKSTKRYPNDEDRSLGCHGSSRGQGTASFSGPTKSRMMTNGCTCPT
jgi:hypothetical protein